MSVKRILVLGGGFAGLWSAVGAVRKLDELGYGPDAVEVMLVNRDGYHNIRVRNYEPDLTSVRIPLDDVLGAIGVARVEGEVASIDFARQTVAVNRESRPRVLPLKGISHVFAAGDAAWAMMDDTHVSVMSCQHGRPMRRFAGHNVVCDLLGLPMLPLRIEWYVTVLDLGPWGAVYTEGWDRHVVAKGEATKRTKQIINCQRIYPPLSGNRQEILVAAAPVVQQAPKVYH